MTLYINCCARKESRTNRLAKVVLQKLGEDFTELNLYEENLRPLDLGKLNHRTELIEREDFSDKMFDCAKQFANALGRVLTLLFPTNRTQGDTRRKKQVQSIRFAVFPVPAAPFYS